MVPGGDVLIRCLLPVDRTTRSATIVAMSTEPLREVRDHFSDVVDRVELHHERVTVTRIGRPVAVLISPEDVAAMEETLDVLSDPGAMAGTFVRPMRRTRPATWCPASTRSSV